MMKNFLLLLVILVSVGVNASELEILSEETLESLYAESKFVAFGEVTGVGGRIALNKVDSFVTIRNEVIPAANLKVILKPNAEAVLGNVSAIQQGEVVLQRKDLAGAIIK